MAYWLLVHHQRQVPPARRSSAQRAVDPLLHRGRRKQVVAAQGLASRDAREAQTRAIMRQVREDAPAILMYEGFKLLGLGPRVKAFPATLGFVRYDLIELTP